MTGLLLGVPLGVVASLVAWWVIFHGISPRIEFAAQVSRLPGSDPLFRLKLKNSGWRSIIDCEVVAELRVKALAPNLPGNTWLIRVPLRTDRFPYLPKGANRLLVFMPYHPDERVKRFVPERAEGYSVDELLKLRDVVRLRVVAFAYDSFSGSRRVFVSKDYDHSDLVTGPYAVSSSLEVRTGIAETEPEDADEA